VNLLTAVRLENKRDIESVSVKEGLWARIVELATTIKRNVDSVSGDEWLWSCDEEENDATATAESGNLDAVSSSAEKE
jgi:hypothetical protein